MIPTPYRLRRYRLALIASVALGLGACSKHDTASATGAASAASAPAQVAVAPVPAPVSAPVAATPAPAPAPVVVAQDDSRSYEQGRRDQQRRDAQRARAERSLPPRADRDVDLGPSTRDADSRRSRHERQVAAARCRECGVVASVTPVKVPGQTNGVGAVAGGVGGALVGNRIAGSHNRALGGVLGAVGGGLLGNAIERHQRSTVVYDVGVRMDDGSLRTLRESTAPAVGEKVRVEADGLHDRS
jgi:outer membrane lipoprotein SlyB